MYPVKIKDITKRIFVEILVQCIAINVKIKLHIGIEKGSILLFCAFLRPKVFLCFYNNVYKSQDLYNFLNVNLILKYI